MLGTKEDRSNGLEHSNQDDLPEAPDIDWEKPPVYQLTGIGDNVSTSVVAQGKQSTPVYIVPEESILIQYVI